MHRVKLPIPGHQCRHAPLRGSRLARRAFRVARDAQRRLSGAGLELALRGFRG